MGVVTFEPNTELGAPFGFLLDDFEALFADHQSAIARDLKINFKKLLEGSSLSQEEVTMATLAVARSLDFREIAHAARITLVREGVDAAKIQEAEETAAIMGMLNTYYRFRHFVDAKDKTGHEGEGYGPAKLRMQSLSNPLIGKQRFEMLAFAVSIINGCEKCVTSHEKALQGLGVENEKLHDLARLAATLKGLRSLTT